MDYQTFTGHLQQEGHFEEYLQKLFTLIRVEKIKMQKHNSESAEYENKTKQKNKC